MLFNSIAFALFLPLVFALYWSPLRRSLRAQNIVLITAGFVFYGWWDWRFLLLLLATSMTDYVVALAMAPAPKRSGVGARGMVGLFVKVGANFGLQAHKP